MAIFGKKQNVEQNVQEQPAVDRALNWSVDFNIQNKTHFAPTSYNDIQEMANTFIRFKEVMFDLSQTENISERHRIIDFMSGIMFSLKGQFRKIDKDVYFFWIND